MKQFSALIKYACACVLAGILFLSTSGFGLTVHAISYITQNTAPPIVAAKDVSGDNAWLVSSDIRVFGSSSPYYLFLPSSANLASVLVRYTGSYSLYDPPSGKTYSNGQTARIDLSSSSAYIYEYRSGTYYQYPIKVMKGSGVTALFFTLTNGDADLIKVNTLNENEVTGTVSVANGSGGKLYDGAMTKFSGRGNGSYDASGKLETKNSYSFNLESDAKLLSSAKKKKKFALLRMRTTDPPWDISGLSFPLAFDSYNALVGKGYEDTDTEYADVYIDNEYRGAYVLSERMDINSAIDVTDLEHKITCPDASTASVVDKSDPAIAAGIQYYTYCKNATVPVGTDITGGYILEITDGICTFKTAHGLTFGLQSPKYATKAQVQYIAKYVQDFENALFSPTGYNSSGKYYREYADFNSLTAQMLFYGFYCNWEFYRTSTFFYKDVQGSAHEKLTFSGWDFECCASEMAATDAPLFSKRYAYKFQFQYAWAEQLWQKGDFMEAMTTSNNHFKSIIQQQIGNSPPTEARAISSLISSAKGSQYMNWIRWSQSGTFDKASQGMASAMQSRSSKWFGTLWNGSNYLLGFNMNASRSSNGTVTLQAYKVGSGYTNYQWYRVNSSNLTTASAITGATSQTYIPSEEGIYYCTVSGNNNAFYEGSSITDFACTSPIFSSRTITMSSASVDTNTVLFGPPPTPKPTVPPISIVTLEPGATALPETTGEPVEPNGSETIEGNPDNTAGTTDGSATGIYAKGSTAKPSSEKTAEVQGNNKLFIVIVLICVAVAAVMAGVTLLILKKNKQKE